MFATIQARPTAGVVAMARPVARRTVLMRANPKQDDISKRIEDAISEAEDVCSTEDTAGCAVAWDNVEELSAEKKHEAQKNPEITDPLEKFCSDEPDADECRVHDN